MADQASRITGSADDFRPQGGHGIADRLFEVEEGDHFVGDTDMTDAEILLRDWCGQE